MHASTITQTTAESSRTAARRLISEEALATHASSATPVVAGFLAYVAAAPFALLASVLLIGGMF